MTDKTYNRSWRWIGLILCIAALCLFINVQIEKEQHTYLGVPARSTDLLSELRETEYFEGSYDILYNGEPCAIDTETLTLYLSQNITPDSTIRTLKGKLEISLAGYELFFSEDESFDDLYASVSEGKTFSLYVTDPYGQYTEFNIVFTTLPVINLTGDYLHSDEKGRDVNGGSFCLWDPYDDKLGRYSVKTSSLEWNIRGATSAVLGKKPWKLSLKDKNNNIRDLDLLGMGDDDDWILNPMNSDDTDVREMLAMTLWDQIYKTTDHNLKMSTGRYVEVVINGSYRGVYILQRRVDKKYLELDDDNILFKGLHTGKAVKPEDGYEIEYSPLSEEKTFSLAEDLGFPNAAGIINIDNFVDVSLFIQFGSMHDNKGYNNSFYALSPVGDSYELTLAMWDTDLSFGVAYYSWFTYDHKGMISRDIPRVERDDMEKLYPDLDARMAERWFELREDVFTRENINEIIEKNTAELLTSGARKRDIALWGEFHKGKDSNDVLRRFINKRLGFLDDYYSEFLNEKD